MRLPQDVASNPLPGFTYSGVRANLTAGAASTRVAIPTGSAGKFLVIRVSAPCWVNFGNSSNTAAADANSMLWTGGELIYQVPASGVTHCAAIRVGAADCALQLELLSSAAVTY